MVDEVVAEGVLYENFSYVMKSEGRDDKALVPYETQKEIVKFFKENLFPAVQAHILSKYPIFFGYPNQIGNVHHFFQLWELWEEIFTPEQQIQLYKMKIILYLPNRAYMVTHLKALLGASMDIIKDFGKPEWKDLLEQSFSDYFKDRSAMENKDNVNLASPNDIVISSQIWNHLDVKNSYPSGMEKLMIWKPDDYKIVPERIQATLVEFIEKTLFPEILTRIGPGCLTMLFGSQFRHVSLRYFCLSLSALEISSSFVKDNSHYLVKLKVASDIPSTTFLKIYGKDLTGAAIHIIKYMGNQKMEDDLRDIVKDCFVPNENPDFAGVKRNLSFHWMAELTKSDDTFQSISESFLAPISTDNFSSMPFPYFSGPL